MQFRKKPHKVHHERINTVMNIKAHLLNFKNEEKPILGT